MFYLVLFLLVVTIIFGFNHSKMQQIPLSSGGRVAEKLNTDGDNYYVYSWPAIYFETAFKGDSLTLKFDDPENIFQLVVDDKAPIIITKPGLSDYPIKELEDGVHHVRLEKLTETQDNTAMFKGFYSEGEPVALEPRSKQIEFIGDSFTVGYGNTSTTRECSDQDVFSTTNSQRAFGPLTAKYFSADYQINAYSGQGVVRNYGGGSPDTNLPARYPYTQNNQQTPYLQADWQPQVIVIGLGTNDFSTPLNDSEKWPSREALRDDYVSKYVDFVMSLRQRSPQAEFILMASDQMDGEIANQVNRVVARLKAQGLDAVDSLIFSGLSYSGCHWHPSVQDDVIMTDLLVEYLLDHPQIWQ